jgi:cytoskeleton protein RodZ
MLSLQEDHSILGLATIRGNRGISLEQISQATKISKRMLEAIEHGDFRKLPGGVYNTNYIRQYARSIDYDESLLLDFYHQASGAPARDSATRPEATTASWPRAGLQSAPR